MIFRLNNGREAFRYMKTLFTLGLVFFIFFARCEGQSGQKTQMILELPIDDNITLDSDQIVKTVTEILVNKKERRPELVTDLLLARSKANAKLGKYDDALADVKQVLAVRKNDVECLKIRASVFFSLGRLKECEADLKELLRINPKWSPTQVAWGVYLLYGKKDERNGLNALDMAISLDSKNPDAYFFRGMFYDGVDPKKCLHDMNKYVELSPYSPTKNPEAPYYYRGSSLLVLNRPKEALSSLLMAFKLAPKNAVIARDISLTYADLGKYHLALHWAQEYVKLDPKCPEGPGMFAEYFFRTGRKEDAEKSLDKLKEMAEKEPRLFCKVGFVSSLMGKFDVTLQYYDKVLNLDPDDYDSLVCKADLLATCPDKKFRNGALAVKLASKAHDDKNVAHQYRWMAAITLAKAHAEVGNFAEASRFAREAITLAGPDFGRLSEFQEMLGLFENKMPSRLKIE